MWYEIFRFELKYRLKRPETYLFFLFLFAFSVFGVDFVFQGVDIGLVKLNAPIIIGKAMGAIIGIFMILASMIMGMPMIRDDQYQITHLFYTNPISKLDLLLGRFLGSFAILIIIFCSVPIGMMLGEFLPWHQDMLPFNMTTYLTSFLIIALPTLFFGAAVFFVTGALSRNLLVVYTQGIIVFVLFLLTKSITNEHLQAILDPFSLTTTTLLSKDWTVAEKNGFQLPVGGVLLINKLFWIGIGILVLWLGYYKFRFSAPSISKKSRPRIENIKFNPKVDFSVPQITPQYGWPTQLQQYLSMSIFYSKTLLKEKSFWAIIVCGIIIIIVNSISLGTVYGVDSYPTTYFIIEELQEMSIYFFVIILLFYSGELYWKEQTVGVHLMSDATPISSLVRIASKVTGLISIYIVLMIFLIFSGISFQVLKGYYHFDLSIYFSGFFIEILPFLIIYTFAAFFIQSLVNHKFLGILLTLIFFIVIMVLGALDYDHVLFYYGGGALESYSEMNGYGHFLAPYLWTKIYWIIFGILVLIFASLISVRGLDSNLLSRLKNARLNLSRNTKILTCIAMAPFLWLGSNLYYQTHILNEVWTPTEQQDYRANYEKTLKQYEYLPQPNIVAAALNLELYPDDRSYDLMGTYILKNETASPINEIHIQNQIASDVSLSDIQFSGSVSADSQHIQFDYNIYALDGPLESGDSITMSFTQTLHPKGYDIGSIGSVLDNGTFIRNNEFPTLGYNRKYELRDEDERELYNLKPRPFKASIDDTNELNVARSGSDSRGIRTKIIIGTDHDQTAITSGKLVKQWKANNRNYFEYHTDEPIINFYAMLSGRYEILEDSWKATDQKAVDLEIYYHPRHSNNLDRMMDGMKASLDYYSTHFTPYQYDQLRIVEFPRYDEFAQSFPNTIPFSESIGFMLDIDDETDIDMTFFVTAHEVAHQWWGMQVEAANVQGKNFVLETLSQYSALMVFKEQFDQSKVDQFLGLQQELYEKGQQKSKTDEVPLHLVENEAYIYYNKGAIVMYNLQKLIGEDRVNLALRLFIQDWNSQNGKIKSTTDRYATSEDLIGYIVEVASESKKTEILKMLKGL